MFRLRSILCPQRTEPAAPRTTEAELPSDFGDVAIAFLLNPPTTGSARQPRQKAARKAPWWGLEGSSRAVAWVRVRLWAVFIWY